MIRSVLYPNPLCPAVSIHPDRNSITAFGTSFSDPSPTVQNVGFVSHLSLLSICLPAISSGHEFLLD